MDGVKIGLTMILVCIIAIICSIIREISYYNEKKADWEQIQITYQCELKEINTVSNTNLYTCKNRKDDTNIINIENSFDLNSSDKPKLKKQCKIIDTIKRTTKVSLSDKVNEEISYELSCDNEKIKVFTNNLNDFLAK